MRFVLFVYAEPQCIGPFCENPMETPRVVKSIAQWISVRKPVEDGCFGIRALKPKPAAQNAATLQTRGPNLGMVGFLWPSLQNPTQKGEFPQNHTLVVRVGRERLRKTDTHRMSTWDESIWRRLGRSSPNMAVGLKLGTLMEPW